ncbi:MAG: mechanosensitive ion channel family protein, partial [Armatimonadota bacterium]|nr:mechanosensitive ion channel family protein [Fimbriimonadaceae bacterium]
MVSARRLLATFTLVVVAVVAYAQVQLDQSNPRALLKTFPEVMRSGSPSDALPALDIDRKPEDNEGSPTPELERTLTHLAEVLDALGVDPSQVPENPGADRLTVQPVRNEFDSLVGNVSLVRNGSRWQFSRETLADLDAIHTAVFRARSGEGTSGEVAKDVVAPDGLKSPRDTMRTFLTAMNEDRPGEAAAALDLRQINSVIRDEEGPRLAALLLAILNRTEYIDLSRIPDDPAEEPFLYRSYTQRATGQAVGSIVLARQEDGGWRFTPTTVKELDAIWQTVKDRPLVSGTKDIDPAALDPSAYLKSQFPPQFHGKTLWLENWQWLSLLGLLLGAGAIGHGVRLVVRMVLRRTLTPDQFTANRLKLRTFGRSLSLVIACSVLHAGLASLGLPEWWRATLLVVAKLGWALGGAMALSAAWDLALAWWSRRDEAQSGRREKLVVPVLSRLARAFLLVLALFVFLAAIGVNVTGIVAGLGIGGLVVALAAKDSVENLFGSVTVLVESPFQLGDWIRIGDVDGVVEEINLRSTRVRTF